MESKDIRVPITLLLLVIAFIVAFVILFNLLPKPQAPQQNGALLTGTTTERPIPPITPAEEAQLRQEPHFAALVSYTDRGFEPASVTVTKGDTVRFTNNSSHPMWVAATGASGHVYPTQSGGCGSSALDSCSPIQSGQFWQFTFAAAGTWSFQNNLNSSDAGIIQVK